MTHLGNKAPVFNAPAVVNGKDIVENFSLTQFLGKQEVVFFFYPKDFTYVCPTELLAFQKVLSTLNEKGVALAGCSTDTQETHRAWLNTPNHQGGIQGVTYPLISDSSKTIAANFGVLGGRFEVRDDGQLAFEGEPVAYRATFLIDKQGIIRHQSVNDMPLGRNIDEIIRIVDMWQHTLQHKQVCPANWQQGKPAMVPTPMGVASYLTQTKHCGCNGKACTCKGNCRCQQPI